MNPNMVINAEYLETSTEYAHYKKSSSLCVSLLVPMSLRREPDCRVGVNDHWLPEAQVCHRVPPLYQL